MKLATVFTILFIVFKSVLFAQNGVPTIVPLRWLKNHLGDKNLVIVDVRDRDKYIKGHIKGAVNISANKELFRGKRLLMPKFSKLRKIFSDAGIDNNSKVVSYDGGLFYFSARLHWLLQVLGHNDAGILAVNYGNWKKGFRRFNEINMLYGYEIGDMLLKEVTLRIKDAFPQAIAISRVENNKFIIYDICAKTIKEELIMECKGNAEYLLTLLHEKAFILKGHIISMSVSMGIVLTEKEDSAKTLFDKANQLLEEAKEHDHNILFFDKAEAKKTQNMTNLYPQLLRAIKNNELELYYQLQYDEQQKPYAAEALIRWNHPKEGLISPALFIPLAEKTGLISQIGRLVLKLGCQQLVEWQKNTLTKDLLLSINLGAKHFQEKDLVEQVKSIVQVYDFPKQNLKIELTEYTMVEGIDIIAKKMQALRDIGIKISLDDFGTGFSSLQYLQFLPIDQLKIDQAFVMNMLKNKTNIAIIKSIISLAEALNMEVIAEGVESKELYEKLTELGCKHFQGYYFAKPRKIAIVNRMLGI